MLVTTLSATGGFARARPAMLGIPLVMYCQDYQSLKPLTTNYLTVHYPRKNTVYLQILEFIGAIVSEFHFFMKIKNIM